MNNKVIRGILKELLNTGIEGTFEPNEYGNKKIAQAETELLAYFRGRVPEKKEMEILPDHAKAFDCLIEGRKEGYNQAIDEILKRLGAEGEGR